MLYIQERLPLDNLDFRVWDLLKEDGKLAFSIEDRFGVYWVYDRGGRAHHELFYSFVEAHDFLLHFCRMGVRSPGF